MHEPVLLEEVCELFELSKKRNVVDATLGMGGHTRSILERMFKSGKVIGFDVDPAHIKIAKSKLRKFKDRVVFINANFADMEEELKKIRIKTFDGFLFDLGIASPHVDDAGRGFSFLREGPLDMRFNPKTQTTTAADVVNKYSEKELIRIFKQYGEEKFARKIVQDICKIRKRKPFKTTTQLAEYVAKTVKRVGRIHPATRIFQALRIEVNKELDVLVEGLRQSAELLKTDGRIAVISYHSLEDRIVKNFFRDMARTSGSSFRIVTKKPVVPTDEEIRRNPRSRSAKLRVMVKM